MTMQGDGVPYRAKQRVLCLFDAIYRYGNSTVTRPDSLMVNVEFSDQIEEALLLAVRNMPDRPMEIRLRTYLPESGRAEF